MKINLRLLRCENKANLSTIPKSTSNGISEKIETKPYTDIPGPKGPLGIGNLYKYLPLIGSYSWQQFHKAGQDKYERYGAIVRERMIPGQDIVWLYDPNDIAILLNERDYPQRRSHLALEKYRKDRPHVYRTAGLLPTNGQEWWRLRSELQKELSVPKKVRSFLTDVNAVTDEFLQKLPLNKSFDLLPKLARLSLELTCLLTFDERLRSFSPEEQQPDSRSSRLIRAATITNSQILPTDQGLQLWRLYETKAYRKLRQAQEYMENVAIDLVQKKYNDLYPQLHQQQPLQQEQQQQLLDQPQPLQQKQHQHLSPANSSTTPNSPRISLIEKYLKNPKLDQSDVVGMAADLILAGIDTTSYTEGFAVYQISRHPEIQERLYEEAFRVLNSKWTPITEDILRAEIPYTRAVLKEIFRLHPISVGVGRILNRDLVLSGYHVPKGSVVVTQNMIACRLEKYFPEPLKLNPDRWLQRKNSINPYLVLPFGHGMRACIARHLAEQNILVFILKLIRNYKIRWNGVSDDLGVRTLLINKPSEPVEIILSERN